MVVYDQTEEKHRVEVTAQSDDEIRFVNELTALLASGGCIRFFSDAETPRPYFTICFDGSPPEMISDDSNCQERKP